MSYTPQPPEPGPDDAFQASEGDLPGPVPEADAPTLENPQVEDSAEPVFVDASGRRRRTLQRIGIGVAGLMAAYLVMLLVSLAGGPRPPVIPLPDPIAGDSDPSETEPDGAESSTPSSPTSEPTPTTDGAGTAGGPPRSSASPTPSPVPPLGAVPPGPTPAPVAPTPLPSPTPTPSLSPTPSPTAAVPSAPLELPGVDLPGLELPGVELPGSSP